MSNGGHDLVAVLDWGLGHASRCVSVVEQLLAEGREVTLASAGKALQFLRKHFPDQYFVELPSYAIRYPYSSMVINMAMQLPRVLKVVRREHHQLRAVVEQRGITRIISDGRFGCWHPGVESIWMAHQLHIQHTSRGLAWVANTAYHWYIRRRFQQAWIPDRATEPRLAGELSARISGLPHEYLGPQSRYSDVLPLQGNKPYRFLALLSGPEPQRSYFEQEVRRVLLAKNAPALLVRGVPGGTEIKPAAGQLQEVDWLLGDDLFRAVQGADQIICRSGYSTLMDAWYWGRPLILVPTPGQTEQEYLARYWADQGWAQWQEQGQL